MSYVDPRKWVCYIHDHDIYLYNSIETLIFSQWSFEEMYESRKRQTTVREQYVLVMHLKMCREVKKPVTRTGNYKIAMFPVLIWINERSLY